MQLSSAFYVYLPIVNKKKVTIATHLILEVVKSGSAPLEAAKEEVKPLARSKLWTGSVGTEFRSPAI